MGSIPSSRRLRRFLWTAGFLAGAFTLAGCSDDPVEPLPSVRTDIVVTDELHHLGDNVGAEGTMFAGSFSVPAAVDSAFVSVSFVYPNPQGQSGPEIVNAPRILLNGTLVGLTIGDFPDNPACIVGEGDTREYACDVTLRVPAGTAIQVGVNSIELQSEAHWGGDDDFVFEDLVVTIWI